MTTAKANAEAQKRWRDRRNALAKTLIGSPQEIAGKLAQQLGAERARAISQALVERFSVEDQGRPRGSQ